MDDFGSILERDYGFGRSGKGRIGSRNSGRMDSNFDSTRFSESFGKSKSRGEFNFRGGSNLSSNWSNSGYGTYAAHYAGSYTVYDEVFSCNMQSTIPFFEDVFRVPSSRMKVSELRDNDILRGIPGSVRKSSSKVTYEDIFGEAPDEFSGPFLSSDLAGSRATTTSSRTSSSGRQSPAYFGTPRKETTEASKLHSESPKSLPLPAQQQRSQGSFLGMTGSLEEKGSLRNGGDWLCVGEVNLTTAPSENPPPLRLAPSRQGSGPPPSRPPPPRFNEEVEQARVGEPLPCSSELLESVLRERNAHAEISIRDKVLDWHKHNMQAEQKEQEKEQEKERGDKVASDSQNSSRSQVLDQLRVERSAIERMAAEVEETAAEQAKLRAERAALEHMERQARAVLMKQPDNGALQNETQHQAQASAEAKAAADGKAIESSVEPQDFIAGDQDTDKINDASEIEGDSRVDGLQGRSSMDDSQKLTGAPSTHDVQATTTDCNIAAEPEDKDASASDIRRDTEEEQRKEEISTPVIPTATIISESESTVSIDTISSSEESSAQTTSENDVIARGGGKEEKEEEEAAPETPERLETTTHARHEKSNKSSELSPEEAIESAWEEEIKRTQQQQEQQEQEQEQQPQPQPQREQEQKQVGTRERVREEARKAAERSLVARIQAEVRERAALEAKARAEKAASLEKKDDRRTKPRLKEETSEVVAKEREDVRGVPAGPSKGSSNGMMRVSLREQLEKERIARLENEKQQLQQQNNNSDDAVQAKLRAERSLAQRITAEVRERAASARAEKAEKEREAKEKERLERLDRARERERERLEKLERERERERERLEREQEREREIEREKDRVSLEERAAKEREAAERKAAEEQQQQRLRMERAAVERATAEARARAERAAYERAAASTTTSSTGTTTTTTSRPTSAPKQRFGSSMSMPSTGTQPMENGNGNMRRATSSTNLDSDRYASAGSREAEHEFQDQVKGETPERRKARLERYQRTQNRAAQALAQKNKRDLELQSEQAERQRLSERLDGEIKRWSAGKDGNIRALLSTLQYVLWPESGWKQVSLTELINPAAVKKAYRRATLCVHPDKMQQKHASVQQKYIAEKVFHILQVAWNKFNSQETL